jgi:small-conductance mechanosensitive channel
VSVVFAPWIAVPALALALVALVRLTRPRPALRPLLGPFVLLAVLSASLSLAGPRTLARFTWLPLLLLAPLLPLVVRGGLIAFETLFRRGQGEPPPALLGSLVTVVLYAVGLGVVAHVFFGFDPTPFLAGSAIAGAVVGLALQDALANLFSGIALHSDAPFRVGDWVRLGEAEGRVEEVTWRALRLRTWSNDTLTLPNNDVARKQVLNFSRPAEPHSRVLTVGVSYAAPPNRVLAVMREVLRRVEGLPEQPPSTVRLVGYADSAVQYEVRYQARAYEDWRRLESEILRLIWYHFRRAGLEIPFPIRTLHVHQADPRREADGPGERLERALRSVDLFRPLSDDERRTAAAAFRHLHYSAGERILGEGEPGDSLFLIDRGEVEVSKLLGGAPRVLARLGAGQFFGEMALLTGEARAASVTAVDDVDLFTLDKAGFERVLARNPAVAVDISAILAARRDALSQAQGDAAAPLGTGEPPGELRQRILMRIRSWFG